MLFEEVEVYLTGLATLEFQKSLREMNLEFTHVFKLEDKLIKRFEKISELHALIMKEGLHKEPWQNVNPVNYYSKLCKMLELKSMRERLGVRERDYKKIKEEYKTKAVSYLSICVWKIRTKGLF